MDFTREPILESVITPKDGCKLVVRSSKGAGQEEFFVDSVEIVSFGSTFFLRSLEKPKSFLVPASDYEVLEVRETRMVLKNVAIDRSIKIGRGREPTKRKETGKVEPKPAAEKPSAEKPSTEKPSAKKAAEGEEKEEPQLEKKKERRRHYRKRRGKEEEINDNKEDTEKTEDTEKKRERISIPVPEPVSEEKASELEKSITSSPSVLHSLLPPPSMLLSESIKKYKSSETFKDIFYSKEEEEKPYKEGETEDFKSEEQLSSPPTVLLEEPAAEKPVAEKPAAEEPVAKELSVTDPEATPVVEEETKSTEKELQVDAQDEESPIDKGEE